MSAKPRDPKGRYVRQQHVPARNDWPNVITIVALALAVLVVYAGVREKEKPLEPLPARVFTQPAEPIDWNKVVVQAIPVQAWQEDHDKDLLRQISHELQRVIDRNEARLVPAFAKHH